MDNRDKKINEIIKKRVTLCNGYQLKSIECNTNKFYCF